MAFSGPAFGIAATLAAGAILKFEAENVLNDGPSGLLDPDPGGAVASVAQAIARQTCRRYAAGVPGLDETTAVNLERVCRPYLDNIGAGEGPKIDLPFRGGQCPGVTYLVTFQLRRFINGAWTYTNPNQTVATGPVSIGKAAPTDVAGCEAQGLFAANAAILNGNGTIARTLSNQCVDLLPGYIIGAITRTDGQADTCGNPEPDFEPPVPPVEPEPPSEPFNPSPDIDIDIEVNLRPDSLIEVNLGFGPIVIPVFGEGGEGGEPGGDPDTSPPAPEPGPELPGGNGGNGGDDNFGDPPAGRRWVGCCIRITGTPESAGVIATSEPEDVYPSVIGNIRLVCNAAGNRLTDTPVRILAKHVCVWEPVPKLNPTGVNVDLLPGYTYVFTPYSVPSGD